MLVSTIRGLVRLCTRFSWIVITLGVLCAVGSGVYAAKHFAINTNIDTLISASLDWRQREAAFERDFPGHFQSTLIVIDAPTPELSSAAAALLAQKLKEQPKLFESVENLSGNEFFARNGLLFQPTEDVSQLTEGMSRAAPLIGTLARDPSLRGLTRALSFGLSAVQQGMSKLDDMVRPMTMSADTLDSVLADKPAVFSWQELLSGNKPTVSETRRFVEVRPVLDFSALEPGKASSDAIRKAAKELDLTGKYQARVRLTGQIPMGDEEFASVQEGALVNGIATVVVVLVILWLALKSGRIIFAVFINLVIGLAITAALGLMMVGAFNVISVAFAVLFVGLGVDFGIQFSVRYRSERHEQPDLNKALNATASEVAVPLTLAAVAVACGFLSFLPTAYRGVSELGLIAGAGMLVAYLTSITVLPALLEVLNPPGEPEEIGYRALAPVDEFLSRHRVGVVGGTIGVAILGAPLLYFLTFDFDPVHLRSPETESISTLLDVQKDPNVNFNSINVIVPSVASAAEVAERLRKLPEVARVATIDSFVPQDQEKKLALIKGMDDQIGFLLNEPAPRQTPTDAENVAALNASADQLKAMAGDAKGPGADAARRLAADLANLAKADKAARDRAQEAFVLPLNVSLQSLHGFLGAQQVTLANLPQGIKRQWVTADGKSRVEVFPKGDANDTEVLRRFASAVLAVYPEAIGGPVSILKSSETVVSAFIHAGLYALVSIAILLWIVLGRFGDMLLTLVPLVLAGVVTLEICVLIGMPLNFANIIALPLLLGVGVAFKIYYITAWRAGQTNLLQSSLTRAVIWSALTTATAFGSLWLSNHPGTSSMGKLLALSLVTTLAAAVLFQPALMGAPRDGDKS